MKIKCSSCHKKYDPEISDFCPKCGTVNSFYTPSSSPEIRDDEVHETYSTMVHDHPCDENDGTNRSEYDKKANAPYRQETFKQETFEPKVMNRSSMPGTIKTTKSTFTNPSTFSEAEKNFYKKTRSVRTGTVSFTTSGEDRSYRSTYNSKSNEQTRKNWGIIKLVIILGFVLPFILSALTAVFGSVKNLFGTIGEIVTDRKPDKEIAIPADSPDMSFEDFADPFGESFNYSGESTANLNGLGFENSSMSLKINEVGVLPLEVTEALFGDSTTYSKKGVFVIAEITVKDGADRSNLNFNNEPRLVTADESSFRREFAYSITKAQYDLLAKYGLTPCNAYMLCDEEGKDKNTVKGAFFYHVYGDDNVFRIQTTNFDEISYSPWFDISTGKTYDKSTAEMEKYLELQSDYIFSDESVTGSFGGEKINTPAYEVEMYETGFVPEEIISEMADEAEGSHTKKSIKEHLENGDKLLFVYTKTRATDLSKIAEETRFDVDILQEDETNMTFGEFFTSYDGGDVLKKHGYLYANEYDMQEYVNKGLLTTDDLLCGMKFYWISSTTTWITPFIREGEQTYRGGKMNIYTMETIGAQGGEDESNAETTIHATDMSGEEYIEGTGVTADEMKSAVEEAKRNYDKMLTDTADLQKAMERFDEAREAFE